MVAYIGVSDIQRLVHAMGTAAFIERLAAEIEADYRRWADFEKCTRLASHSQVGVIELMPTSDAELYSFKYVNGHPKNTAAGLLTVTAFGYNKGTLATVANFDVTANEPREFDVPSDIEGYVFVMVTAKSPASSAGLKSGYSITALGVRP